MTTVEINQLITVWSRILAASARGGRVHATLHTDTTYYTTQYVVYREKYRDGRKSGP